jgi:guanylate kinase
MHKIIVITAPSGAGKTSITHYLLKRFPLLSFSVSATTRKPRANEKDGIDYYFLSPATFQEKIQENAFVEYEMVYEGMYYGTLKSEMERIWKNGQVPLLDIDVRGAMNVQQLYSGRTLSLFILPPSLDELKRRLEKRGTETPDSLLRRVAKAEKEMESQLLFDERVVNDILEKACEKTGELISAFLSAHPQKKSESNL